MPGGKICLASAPSAGKTSLLKASVGAPMPKANYRASVGEENVKVYLLDSGDITDQASSAGQGVVFHVWSLPGQQAAAPVASNPYMHNASFYRMAVAVVITIDCTTLDEISNDEFEASVNVGASVNNQTTFNNPVAVGSALVAAARRNVPDIAVFLCLTKCDLLKNYQKGGKTVLNPIDPRIRSEHPRLFSNAERFIAENNCNPNLICTSALDRNGLSRLYSAIYEEQQERQRKLAAGANGAGDGNVGPQSRPAVNLVPAYQAEKKTGGCPCK